MTQQIMAVLLNGVAQLEYDRSMPLPPQQQLYLDRMDQTMDGGVEIAGEHIANPDRMQRAQFVAGNLIVALLSNNEPLAAATCSYLAQRFPDLKQVKATDHNGETSIELVFDEPYKPQVRVDLTPPSKTSRH